jgi:CheY-like chemotaxis protein
MACFILNGINQSKRDGGTCTIYVLPATHLLAKEDHVGVRFAVKDDGAGVSRNPKQILWDSSASLPVPELPPISIEQFRSTIAAHDGIIGVDSKPGKGACYFFEINFEVPSKQVTVVEVVTNRSKGSTKLSAPIITTESISSHITSSVDSTYDTVGKSISIPVIKLSPIFPSKTDPLPAIVTPEVKDVPIEEAKPFDVLVVDDVISNRRMTGRILERMGFVVDDAEDGEIAVEKCMERQNGPFKLIIMDNMMPRMTGREATAKLRSLEYDGVIIGLTGNVLEEDLDDFAKSGCNEVITKPLDVAELKRAILEHGVQIPNAKF